MKKSVFLMGLMSMLFSCTHKLHRVVPDPIDPVKSLTGEWMIIQVNGEKVVKEKSGKELPYLDFNTKDYKLIGSTGCNRITGTITVAKNAIDFGPIAATRVFCMNAMYETPILQILRGNLSYTLDKDLLTLNKEGKAVMQLQAK